MPTTSEESVTSAGDLWWQKKFSKAFGGKILSSEDDVSTDEWYARWSLLVSNYGNLYDLPGGNMGRTFVDVFAKEITLLVEGRTTSEQVIVFCRVILQRDNGIRKGNDVRRLISGRLDQWKGGNYAELVQEAIRCSRQGVKRRRNRLDDDEDHRIKVFTRFVWKGEVRAAVRWITGKMNGEVMEPNEIIEGSNGKTDRCISR